MKSMKFWAVSALALGLMIGTGVSQASAMTKQQKEPVKKTEKVLPAKANATPTKANPTPVKETKHEHKGEVKPNEKVTKAPPVKK